MFLLFVHAVDGVLGVLTRIHEMQEFQFGDTLQGQCLRG